MQKFRKSGSLLNQICPSLSSLIQIFVDFSRNHVLSFPASKWREFAGCTQIFSFDSVKHEKSNSTLNTRAPIVQLNKQSLYAYLKYERKHHGNLRNSRPEVFLVKCVLKICSNFAGEHPCRSVISITLLCNVIEITLRHGC